MIFSNFKGIIIAIATLTSIENGANAFVPENTRIKIGGGKSLISTPSESLSFASYFQKQSKERQQRSPRMPESRFRLDYVQGIRPPQKVPATVKDDTKKPNNDFIYGRDSTCYRGLTEPTKAGLVLALVLVSGLIVASPDIHLPSVTSIIEGARHLMGDDAAAELSALVERMAFQWDMSGLEERFHDVSDQLALSFNNELLPFSLQLRDNLQEATTTISGQFDVLLAQIASQIDSMKLDFTNTMTSPEAMFNQVLVNGRETLSQRSNEWQLASQDKIGQLNQYVAQATSNLQGGISQVLNKGRELFAGNFAGQLKIDQLDLNFVQDSSELRTQAIEEFTRSKEAIVSKSLEYQQASQMGMDEKKTGILQTNQQLQGLADQYADEVKGLSLEKYSAVNMDDLEQRALGEAVKYREMANSFVAPKYSELQELSQAKMTDIGQSFFQETQNIQRRLVEVGTEFEMKGKDATRDLVPFIQDSGRLLQQQMLALRDSSFEAINKVKDQTFQGQVSIGAIEETLQEWRDGAAKALSSAENSITGQLAFQDTLQDLKDSAKAITSQVSIQNSLRELKDGVNSIASQVSIDGTLQDLKDGTASMANQISVQNTLQDLKDSAVSITNQVDIQDTLQELRDGASSMAGQLSIDGTLQDLKDNAASMANQVSIKDTLQDLKDGASSMAGQLSIDGTLQDLKDSAASMANQVSIKDTLQDLKDGASSMASQVSIDGTLQDLKDNAASMANQVSIKDTLQDLKDSTESISNQVAIKDTLQDLKDNTHSIPNQVAIKDTLQDLKDSTANAWSNAGKGISNQVGAISRHSDPAGTESSYLKSILDDVAY